MNILTNDTAMAILQDTADKLQALGFPCQISPTALLDYDMTVSLHVSSSEAGTAAAHVSHVMGATAAHVDPERFTVEIAGWLADKAALDASASTQK